MSEISGLDFSPMPDDPQLVRLVEIAQHTDNILSESSTVDEADLDVLAQAIEEDWEYLYRAVTVTGLGYYAPDQDSDLPSGALITQADQVFLDEVRMTSQGFSYVQFQHAGRWEWRVAHSLVSDQESFDHESGEWAMRRLRCLALIDQVHIDPEFVSKEIIIQRCAYYFPNFLDQIDEVTLNSDSPESAALDLSSLIFERTQGYSQREYELLEAYVNDQLMFEPDTRFDLGLADNPTFFVLRDSGEPIPVMYKEWPRILVSDISLVLMQAITNSNDSDQPEVIEGKMMFGLNCTVHDQDPQRDYDGVVIPLQSITELRDIRRLYYEALS